MTFLKSYSTSNASTYFQRNTFSGTSGATPHHLDDFVQCNTNDWDGKLSNNLFTPVMWWLILMQILTKLKGLLAANAKPIDIVVAILLPARVVNTV